MMLPLAGYRATSDAVLLGPNGEVSAGVFFERVRELAPALPDTPFVINLAESRAGFMLGFAAALVRRQTSLFPSGQGRGDWEQLVRQYPNASIISDRAMDAPDAFDLRPWLAIDTVVVPHASRESEGMRIPAVPADFRAAILFTSGSTGQPTAHAKSWGHLTRGAANLIAALGGSLPTRCAVVGSVPQQHMFGLESTVMLPWHAGIPVYAHKPLLPADLDAALAQCARPCWWMTTAVHLRPPLQAASSLGGLAGIVASTMSLPPALAVAAETKWRVPVVEIYGSTETGALATRRTATDEWWTPLRGVELRQQAEGEGQQIHAAGSHIDGAVPLADELRFGPDGRFLWLGRSADMLKIAGKRASLSALNQWISEIPGVEDGVYFVPDAAEDAASHDDAHPTRRLAAFYVSATLSPDQVRTALRARVDPVFVPRPLIRVPQLPRNANGKLPQAALAELFSQSQETNHTAPTGRTSLAPPPLPLSASAVSRKQRLIVPVNHPAIAGHFPGNPIVPGVVILSQVADAISQQLPDIVLGTLLSMHFHAPLRPGQSFMVLTEIRSEEKPKRVYVEVRHDDDVGSSGTLIASGLWAVGVGISADDGS